MIEKLLEDKIVAAIDSLGIKKLSIVGAWSKPVEETMRTSSALTVVVGPRTYSRYTVCEATFPVMLDLVVSTAVDKDGELFLSAATAISDMLHVWNMNRHNEAKTALAVEDKLSIGGIRVEGGDAPFYDRDNARRSMSISFSVTGFVSHTLTTN